MVEGFIPEETYRAIVSMMPILCVDVVLRDSAGKYLLVKRVNEPLSGEWWVVGGRVLQGETVTDAAARKVREETGLVIDSFRPAGFYEGFYRRNSHGAEGRYHTLSVVFTAELDTIANLRLDQQSSEWQLADRLPDDFVIQCFEPGTD